MMASLRQVNIADAVPTPTLSTLTETSQIKGSALLGLLSWIGEHVGREARARLVADVDDPSADVFRAPIRAGRWYPYDAYTELLRRLEERLISTGSAHTLRDAGRWTGKRDLGGILKIVSVFTTPQAVVVRGFGSWGASYWSNFCDAGTVRLVSHHPHGATVALEQWSSVSRQHCVLMEGWWEAMAEAAGARDVEVHQSCCVHRGDDRCEFVGTWR